MQRGLEVGHPLGSDQVHERVVDGAPWRQLLALQLGDDDRLVVHALEREGGIAVRLLQPVEDVGAERGPQDDEGGVAVHVRHADGHALGGIHVQVEVQRLEAELVERRLRRRLEEARRVEGDVVDELAAADVALDDDEGAAAVEQAGERVPIRVGAAQGRRLLQLLQLLGALALAALVLLGAALAEVGGGVRVHLPAEQLATLVEEAVHREAQRDGQREGLQHAIHAG